MLQVYGETPKLPEFPATWGQSYQWEILDHIGPINSAKLHTTTIVPVPRGASVHEVREALQHLYRRHDALRTEISGSSVRDLHQRVLRSAEVECRTVMLTVGAERTTEVFDALVARPFAAGELMSRIGMLYVEDELEEVAIITSHLITDAWSARQLSEELTALIRGKQLAPRAPQQTSDVFEFERSAAGQARERASIEHWQRISGTIERDGSETRSSRVSSPSARFREGVLRSPQLFKHASRAGHRLGVRTSAVVIGALGRALCEYFDVDSLALLVRAPNRLDPWSRQVLTTANQQAPVLVSRRAADEAGYYRQVSSGVLLANKYSYYSPAALNEALRPFGSSGLTPYEVSCAVNFVPSSKGEYSEDLPPLDDRPDTFHWVAEYDTSQLAVNSNIYEELSEMSLFVDSAMSRPEAAEQVLGRAAELIRGF